MTARMRREHGTVVPDGTTAERERSVLRVQHYPGFNRRSALTRAQKCVTGLICLRMSAGAFRRRASSGVVGTALVASFTVVATGSNASMNVTARISCAQWAHCHPAAANGGDCTVSTGYGELHLGTLAKDDSRQIDLNITPSNAGSQPLSVSVKSTNDQTTSNSSGTISPNVSSSSSSSTPPPATGRQHELRWRWWWRRIARPLGAGAARLRFADGVARRRLETLAQRSCWTRGLSHAGRPCLCLNHREWPFRSAIKRCRSVPHVLDSSSSSPASSRSAGPSASSTPKVSLASGPALHGRGNCDQPCHAGFPRCAPFRSAPRVRGVDSRHRHKGTVILGGLCSANR